jgi:TATA-binding protein-associated factor Taf7
VKVCRDAKVVSWLWLLVAWMCDDNTKTWSEGLRFIQSGKTKLCLQASRQPYEAMFGTAQRIGLADSSLTEDMYCSIETEQELEQLFNAEMNSGGDKEHKKEANQQDRKDEDENQTNDSTEETAEKKENKKCTNFLGFRDRAS